MSICASGASTTKTGVPAAVVVDQAYVQSILPAGLAWAYPYLPFMHGLEIGDVGAFCALDPPTWSVPTASEIFSFITGGPLTEVQIVNDFLQNITKAYLWYSLCQCSSGATPAPPAAPPAPANLPAVNPVGIVTGAPNICAAYGPASEAVPNGGWVAVYGTVVFASSVITTGVPVPAGATQVRLTATVSGAAIGLTTLADLIVHVTTGSQTHLVGGDFPGATPNGTQVNVRAIPANADYFALAASGNAANSATVTMTAEFFCGGVPGQQAVPCCPPDPVATGLLNQILDLVTIIQRQAAPFAYVAGAVHSGLTGAGQLTVADLIGAKIVVTATTPGTIGVQAGDPEFLWGLGWINWGSADGFAPREWLTSTDTVSLPSAAGAYTLLGYSLSAGVTVTITELVREP